MKHADGRPVAYINATAVALFACQQPDSTYITHICARADISPGKLRVYLDGDRYFARLLRHTKSVMTTR
jgi:hypothetical protein